MKQVFSMFLNHKQLTKHFCYGIFGSWANRTGHLTRSIANWTQVSSFLAACVRSDATGLRNDFSGNIR